MDSSFYCGFRSSNNVLPSTDGNQDQPSPAYVGNVHTPHRTRASQPPAFSPEWLGLASQYHEFAQPASSARAFAGLESSQGLVYEPQHGGPGFMSSSNDAGLNTRWGQSPGVPEAGSRGPHLVYGASFQNPAYQGEWARTLETSFTEQSSHAIMSSTARYSAAGGGDQPRSELNTRAHGAEGSAGNAYFHENQNSGEHPASIQMPDQNQNSGLTVPCAQAHQHRRSSLSSSTESSTSFASDPVTCNHCGKAFSGEYRKGNLARHKRQKHGKAEQVFPCEENGCPQNFKRQDSRLKHYRKHHPWLAPDPPLLRK